VIGWLTCSRADVPSGDGWLSASERTTLAGLRSRGRASDWRLGRWAAKTALMAWDGWAAGDIEVLASPGGAPEVLLAGLAAPVSISLSHRGGRALAVVADPDTGVGCDLELTEPRSAAFVRTWLAPSERAEVEAASGAERRALVNLLWTAKEAATKLRSEGLRLDPRDAVIELDSHPMPNGEWRPLDVRWLDQEVSVPGWWRQEPGWVLACVTDPATPAPVAL
jgi:4'-phosphopantetheinyl transferase